MDTAQLNTTATLEPAADVFHCVACGTSRAGRRAAMPADSQHRPFNMLKCADCGLVQQHPRYTEAQIESLYDGDYYVFQERESARWARAVQQYVIHILPHESRAPRRMLDLGCAQGHLSALARRRGWRVIGIDLSAEAVSQAVTQLDVEARAGTLTQYRTTLPPFDLVFLGDVIEHAADPARLLKEVHQILAPNAVVCIDTPNWNSRWRKFGGERWLGLNRFHINLFDGGSLRALLERCDFTDIETGSYTNYRYASWADRPEIHGVIEHLPKAIGWRVTNLLTRFRRQAGWVRLQQDSPEDLDQARRRVNALAREERPALTTATADNLVASARRK